MGQEVDPDLGEFAGGDELGIQMILQLQGQLAKAAGIQG